MIRTAVALVGLVVLTSCAAVQKKGESTTVASDEYPGVYLVHPEPGEILVNATHFDAAQGVLVSEEDLKIMPTKKGGKQLRCQREVPTGSHVPEWFCGYVDEGEASRRGPQRFLQHSPPPPDEPTPPGGATK